MLLHIKKLFYKNQNRTFLLGNPTKRKTNQMKGEDRFEVKPKIKSHMFYDNSLNIFYHNESF